MQTQADKRKDRDLMKLIVSKYEVSFDDEKKRNDFYVRFKGPKGSAYENVIIQLTIQGIWNVHVHLPEQYPFKSPSIGFTNKLFHPNVDEAYYFQIKFSSGSVCLDVINQSWSPMYDLINIFDVFIPQLLLYPNPTDPLNAEAANLLIKDEKKYNEKVKEYVKKYALSDEDVVQNDEEDNKSQASELSEASELSNLSDNDL